MKAPATPIQELDSKATLPEVVAKINELIRVMNSMWNPEDGTE